MLSSSMAPPMTRSATLREPFPISPSMPRRNSKSAEYGRTGVVVISIISKSGTNEYHGSLFEYLRNNKMISNYFFSNSSGAKLAPLAVNQYGRMLGGPI